MKRLCLLLIALVLSACEGETVYNPDDNPCPKWQIQVQIGQKVRLVDVQGNWSDSIDFDKIRLYSTDHEWNKFLNADGEPFKETPNGIEARPVYDENDEILYIQLALGQNRQAYDIDKDTCYFLLKVNDNSFHQIKAEYYTECGDFILTKFTYNGTEYTADDWSVIDIMVE